MRKKLVSTLRWWMRRRKGWLRCRLPRLVALVPCGAWTNPVTSANGLPETSKVALGTFGQCSAQASQVARQQHKETLTWLPHVESLRLGTQVRWSHRVDYIACLTSLKMNFFYLCCGVNTCGSIVVCIFFLLILFSGAVFHCIFFTTWCYCWLARKLFPKRTKWQGLSSS